MTAKSLSIKVRGCKSGRCVVKAVELTSGGLRRVLEARLRKPWGHWSRRRSQQKA